MASFYSTVSANSARRANGLELGSSVASFIHVEVDAACLPTETLAGVDG